MEEIGAIQLVASTHPVDNVALPLPSSSLLLSSSKACFNGFHVWVGCEGRIPTPPRMRMMKRMIRGGDCWLNESWAKEEEEDRRHCGLGMKMRLRAEEKSWDSLGRSIWSFALPI